MDTFTDASWDREVLARALQRGLAAEGFVVEECSNFPLFDHPVTAPLACYEADTAEPAEGCPAPVTGSRSSEPGSVRWWQPEGDRRAQGPIPEPEDE